MQYSKTMYTFPPWIFLTPNATEEFDIVDNSNSIDKTSGKGDKGPPAHLHVPLDDFDLSDPLADVREKERARTRARGIIEHFLPLSIVEVYQIPVEKSSSWRSFPRGGGGGLNTGGSKNAKARKRVDKPSVPTETLRDS